MNEEQQEQKLPTLKDHIQFLERMIDNATAKGAYTKIECFQLVQSLSYLYHLDSQMTKRDELTL